MRYSSKSSCRKNYILYAVTILIGIRCDVQSEKPKIATAEGFINSQTFKTYLDQSGNAETTLRSDKLLFSLIGEDDFLFDAKYDFYSIYIYYPSKKTLSVYVVKSRNNISLSLYKEVNTIKTSSTNDSTDTILHSDVSVFTNVVTANQINAFREKLDNATKKIKPSIPKDYDNPYRMLLYFDGNTYYRMSDQQLDEKTLSELDTFYRSSELFRKSVKNHINIHSSFLLVSYRQLES